MTQRLAMSLLVRAAKRRLTPASAASPGRRSKTSTSGSGAPPPSEYRTAREPSVKRRSMFRKPKSQRWTHAERPSAVSESCSQVQPLIAGRDGPLLSLAATGSATARRMAMKHDKYAHARHRGFDQHRESVTHL